MKREMKRRTKKEKKQEDKEAELEELDEEDTKKDKLTQPRPTSRVLSNGNNKDWKESLAQFLYKQFATFIWEMQTLDGQL